MMMLAFKKLWIFIRYGIPTRHVTGTAGHNVAAEIEYRDRRGNMIAFWAYGSWQHGSSYHGEFDK